MEACQERWLLSAYPKTIHHSDPLATLSHAPLSTCQVLEEARHNYSIIKSV